jgi:5-methylthioribose kinase
VVLREQGNGVLEFTLSAESACDYVASRWGVAPGELRARELAGGVSNVVVRVETGQRGDLILKQSLEKLRVREDWFCDRTRIFREMDALRTLGERAPAGSLPSILFEDRANYLFAMSAADENAPTWKELLLDGQVDLDLARQVARLHAVFFEGNGLETQFAGLELFDQLRLDPYYRATALRHPDLAPQFEQAIQQSQTNLRGLTHGDWSPKNFLVNGGGRLFSIDYEVMHWGDPSFDVAFLLNHFLLKAWLRARERGLYRELALEYWRTLLAHVPAAAEWLEAGAMRHLGCLHLARVDGKSPVEYLNESLRAQVRRFARDLVRHPARGVVEVFEMQAEACHE